MLIGADLEKDGPMGFSKLDLVRVFEADPGLLEGLGDEVTEHLAVRVVARRACVDVGPWEPAEPADAAGHLGLLVLDGMLVRTIVLAGRECSELVGPGDLIRPWDPHDANSSVECVTRWRALQPTAVASLDARFAAGVARWPVITSALIARGTRRCWSLAYQATIAHVRHAETRVVLLLWHLADRWGRVTPDGVIVPVPMTHQLLAQLTCLQRPTVSAALRQLADDGGLSRTGEGGWLLHGDPPADAPAGARALVA